jgi:hypothetical protein
MTHFLEKVKRKINDFNDLASMLRQQLWVELGDLVDIRSRHVSRKIGYLKPKEIGEAPKRKKEGRGFVGPGLALETISTS